MHIEFLLSVLSTAHPYLKAVEDASSSLHNINMQLDNREFVSQL